MPLIELVLSEPIVTPRPYQDAVVFCLIPHRILSVVSPQESWQNGPLTRRQCLATIMSGMGLVAAAAGAVARDAQKVELLTTSLLDD